MKNQELIEFLEELKTEADTMFDPATAGTFSAKIDATIIEIKKNDDVIHFNAATTVLHLVREMCLAESGK